MNIIFVLAVVLLVTFEPSPAFAYLDPGTGSMLLSVCIGLLSAGYFMLMKLPSLGRSLLFKASRRTAQERKHIVIYGESANYWGTFRPLLEEFAKRNIPVEYLTSTKDDPCFKAGLPHCITCKYIGIGNAAYTVLNFIKADVMVLTTPGVGVLQIRRSKGVGKYIHVVHALGDFHYYKLFSLDYYDAVICNGRYQVRTVRALEEVRGTHPKELVIAGCPYLDGIVKRKLDAGESSRDPKCVLIAPTWGQISLLNRFGAAVPKILAGAGYNVILRPHPQSYISDIELMKRLEKELSGYSNITWDKNPDGFASLNKAAVLISDFSGVVFDFAFTFLKPVITLFDDNQDPGGFEAFDLKHPRWTTEALSKIGHTLTNPNIENLPKLVLQTLSETDWSDRIRKLRDDNIANFGCAAGPVVDSILAIASKASK